MNGTAEYVCFSLDGAAELLCQRKNTLILFHHNPDGDATGSAFALKVFLDGIGARAYCICPDEMPERLRFISDGLQESVLECSIPEGFEPELWKQLLYHREKWVSPAMQAVISLLGRPEGGGV